VEGDKSFLLFFSLPFGEDRRGFCFLFCFIYSFIILYLKYRLYNLNMRYNMLEAILSSKSKEKILLFLAARKEGYAFEIAKYYSTSLSPIQNQLENLENGGVIISKLAGKTRMYSLNQRYPFIRELTALIEKAITFLPDEDRERLLIYRKRPRRKGKP